MPLHLFFSHFKLTDYNNSLFAVQGHETLSSMKPELLLIFLHHS